MSNKIELLAPAGSFETLHAAINAGCHAGYFGVSDFNMRASAAANFTIENLKEVAEICKKNRIRSYVTVNTVLYNEDIEKMKSVINAVHEAGIDAIIASDMAAILYARSVGVEVHISTQVSISNIESVKFYSQFASRIVLARELTLEQVKNICDEIKEQDVKGPDGRLVEIEVFAHGALCVAVSGRCAMSLYCYNSSANKGKCTHVCRRKYKVTDTETGRELIVDNNYVMSSADLCTIGMIDKLVDAGVKVFKLEGRGRSPEYVDTVVRAYKEALDSVDNGTYSNEKIKAWNEKLKTVFNRGFTENFYMGRKVGEWSGVNGSRATEEKFLVGVVQRYYPKIKVVQIEIRAKDEVKTGEKFSITGDTTGVVMGNLPEMKLDELKVESAKQGDVVTFELKDRVKVGDKFFVIRKRK